jgi:DNA-binding SARP family transcriptional activator/Flp pilus assembly protein TadD
MQSRLVLLGPVGLTGPTGQLLRRASQQRRMALLALVATAPGASISRDRLLGLLWPDRDERTARHLLADSLYVLRQALGDDAFITTGEAVRLSGGLHVDVTEFNQALSDERWGDALALYRGDFLDGFFVRDAADFDQWALTQRTHLRDLATRAASAWARELERAGQINEAVTAAERALALAPLDENVFRDLVKLLIASGNRARAESIARSFKQRLEDELGVSPSAETMSALRSTRARPGAVDSITAGIIAQGRYHWHRRTPWGVERSITYFTRAVERDPRAADAWCGLADAWSVMGGRGYAPAATAIERASEYAARALAIDDTLAAAYISLGGMNIVRRRWHDAASSLRRAIALDPQNADAHHWLSLTLLTGFGLRDDALHAQVTAATLNPVSPVQVSSLGWQRYLRGEYDLARSVMEPAVDLSVEIDEAPAGLARVAARLGDEQTVMTAISAGLVQRSEARGDLLAEQASAFAVLGDSRRGRQLALEASASDAMPIRLAIAWASLNDVDRALAALERESFQVYWTPHLVWWDPLLDAVRGESRFAKVRQRIARAWSPEFV